MWLQAFAGVGIGHFGFTDISTDQSAYSKFHDAGITKFYVQPAFMFKPKDFFSIAISARLSVIKFGDIKTNYVQEELVNYHLDNLGKPFVFWEPTFVNSFGFKKLPGVKIEYQFGISTKLSEIVIDQRSFNFSIGAFFDIPKLLTKNSL